VREYTLAAVAAALAVVAAEVWWLRTGIFRRRTYWVTMVIVFAFQVAVDGWLTKRSAPIVLYRRGDFLGVRFPLSIPIEDFAYGFALVTLTIALWERAGTLHPDA
jgi:lycopene cyclase domain-containing protein